MSTYRALPDNLKDIADATQKYLIREYGLNSSKIKIECGLSDDISFSPTIHVVSNDKHIICAEVVEELFTPDIEQFVLACRNYSLPVKLYVAVRRGQFPSYDQKVLKTAKDNGIAILEIHPPSQGTLINQAPVPQSIGGLRAFVLHEYPAKYREQIKRGIETFRNGNPVKGCSDIYDLIEQLSRKIGKKCAVISGGLKNTNSFDWDRESWANILEFMKNNVNKAAIGCPKLNTQLFSRLIGMTEYRNESGHIPSSVQKLIERDKQLRTRFESAMDELAQLIDAVKPLRI